MSDLKQLLEANTPYFKELENGRIECILNGHHFPPNLAVIQAFINGKKYHKLRERHVSEDLAKKYDPIIIQSRNAPEMLFCVLTGQLLNKSEEAIKKHFAGRRFLKAKELMETDDHIIYDEPNLEEVMREMAMDDADSDADEDADEDPALQPFQSSQDTDDDDDDDKPTQQKKKKKAHLQEESDADSLPESLGIEVLDREAQAALLQEEQSPITSAKPKSKSKSKKTASSSKEPTNKQQAARKGKPAPTSKTKTNPKEKAAAKSGKASVGNKRQQPGKAKKKAASEEKARAPARKKAKN